MMFGIEYAKSIVENARMRRELETAKLAFHKNLYNQRGQLIAESVANIGDRDSGPVYDCINYATRDAIDDMAHQELLRRMDKLATIHPLAVGWIDTFVKFTVGDEFQLKSEDHDPRTQAAWDEFAQNVSGPDSSDTVPFEIYAKQVVEKGAIFGENLERVYVEPNTGRVSLRTMNPIYLGYGYTANFQWGSAGYLKRGPVLGVVTAPNDIQEVIAYNYDDSRNGVLLSIPAENVLHFKRGHTDMVRGRPLLLRVLQPLLRLDRILEARQRAHEIKATMSVWYDATGASPTAVDELIAQRQATSGKVKQPTIGSITVAGNGMVPKFEVPNMQAQDGYHDIIMAFNVCGVALGLATYVVANDASTANLASSRETTYPMLRTFEGEQRLYGIGMFEKLHARVIQEKIKAGFLKPTSFEYRRRLAPNGQDVVIDTVPVPRKLGAICNYPALKVEDLKAHYEGLALMVSTIGEDGFPLMSTRSARIEAALNNDEEKMQCLLERREAGKDRPSAQAELEAALKNGSSDNGNGAERTNGNRIPSFVR